MLYINSCINEKQEKSFYLMGCFWLNLRNYMYLGSPVLNIVPAAMRIVHIIYILFLFSFISHHHYNTHFVYHLTLTICVSRHCSLTSLLLCTDFTLFLKPLNPFFFLNNSCSSLKTTHMSLWVIFLDAFLWVYARPPFSLGFKILGPFVPNW